MSLLTLPSTHYAHFKRCRAALSERQYWLLLYLASQPQRWHVRRDVISCGAFICHSIKSSVWLDYARPMAASGLLLLERQPWAQNGGYATRITAKGLEFLGFHSDVQEVAS